MSNIRVVCRFRPQNSIELSENGEIIVEIQDGTVKLRENSFSFDKIFDWNTSQLNVFEYAGIPLVNQCLEGFNSTLFAYGQTGSGKTFTMMGSSIDDEQYKGLTPRLVELIFKLILEASANIEFTVKVSFMEIYMERIRDLLLPSNDNLPVHEDKLRGVYVKGLKEIYVSSAKDVYEVMRIGDRSRTVASTNMNEQSSRSHSIFVLTIGQKDLTTGSNKSGSLYLVDLAGSEKIGKTGATGQTLEEAKKINKSLTALGMVINALTDGKSNHIPYRDSKLTRILQESLGGNSKTTLIINCSPSSYNDSETISTLRFGIRAKSITNKAHVNVELSATELKIIKKKLEGMILSLKNVISELESELEIWRNGGTVSPDKYAKKLESPILLEGLNTDQNTELTPVLKEDEKLSLSELQTNLKDEIEEKDTEIESLKDKLEKLNLELTTLKSQESKIQIEHKDILMKLDAINLEYEKIQFEKKESDIGFEMLKEENSELVLKIKKLEEENNEIRDKGLLNIPVSTQSLISESNTPVEVVHANRDQLKAEKTAEMMKEFIDPENNNAVIINEDLKNENSKLNNVIMENQDIITKLEKELFERDEKLRKLEDEFADYLEKDVELSDVQEMKMKLEQSKKESLDLEILNYKNELAEKEKMIKKLNEQLKNDTTSSTQKDPTIENLEKAMKQQVADFEVIKKSLMRDLQNRCEKVVDLEITMDEIREQYSQLLRSNNSKAQQKKMLFLERNLDQLTGVQKQLVDQNTALKKNSDVQERKIQLRNERIQTLEKTIQELSIKSAEDYDLQEKEKEDLRAKIKLLESKVQKRPSFSFGEGRIAKPLRGGHLTDNGSTNSLNDSSTQ